MFLVYRTLFSYTAAILWQGAILVQFNTFQCISKHGHFALILFIRTEDVRYSYCTSSLVLMICLISTAHPGFYCTSSLVILHILACADDVRDYYCTSSLVLHILARNAHSLYNLPIIVAELQKVGLKY